MKKDVDHFFRCFSPIKYSTDENSLISTTSQTSHFPMSLFLKLSMEVENRFFMDGIKFATKVVATFISPVHFLDPPYLFHLVDAEC